TGYGRRRWRRRSSAAGRARRTTGSCLLSFGKHWAGSGNRVCPMLTLAVPPGRIPGGSSRTDSETAMARSYQDLLADSRPQVPETQVGGRADRLAGADPPLVIDVREQSEWDEGHVPGAVFVPRGHLESRIGGVATHGRDIVLACASGRRSLLAGRTLLEMGYE